MDTWFKTLFPEKLMKLEIFQVDAFTTQVFKGNPAAVVPLKSWLPDDVMLNIARENNLAETAFFIPSSKGEFELKWYTPEIEMDLCGHATLATAVVIRTFLYSDLDKMTFHTMSGPLHVRYEDEFYVMDFPSRPAVVNELPDSISEALSIQPAATFKARDYMLVYPDENSIRELDVDPHALSGINLDPGGIIVTAKGDHSDFVSRFFTPGAAIFEDPVTGSAHCTLTPYWAEHLKKTELKAFQISERGGELICKLRDDRVELCGKATVYLKGEIFI